MYYKRDITSTLCLLGLLMLVPFVFVWSVGKLYCGNRLSDSSLARQYRLYKTRHSPTGPQLHSPWLDDISNTEPHLFPTTELPALNRGKIQ